MSAARFADGIVVDHVADFAYLPQRNLRQLYRMDPLGHVDAVARFVQLVATSPTILFGRDIKKSETARLREALRAGGKVDDQTPAFSTENRALRRLQALPALKQHWPQIQTALTSDSRAQEAIRGHVLREFHYVFLASPTRRSSMDHYVSTQDAYQIPEPLRSSLVTALDQLRTKAGHSRDEVARWLDRTVTTQYRVFFEHCQYSMFDYCPAVTRSHLFSILPTPESGSGLHSVTRCIAGKVLANLKQRADLIPVTLEWCNTTLGQRVLKGFNALRAEYQTSTEREKQELLSEVDGILKSQVGWLLGFGLGTLGIVSSIATGKEPEPKTRALRTPLRYWWLWELRDLKARQRVERRIEGLVVS